MERRTMLKTSLGVLGTTTLVSFLYPLGRFLAPLPSRADNPKVTLNKSEIPPGAAKEITFNNTPCIVIHRRVEGFVAFSRVCTHLGCLVGWDKFKNEFVCPCHAGVFNVHGQVLTGPAPRPLTQIPISVEPETITIG